MTAARLRALRVVGFKSFAEKTLVEFGPGVSAVVGPNGSGKSNLADALRWALGEQGRSLRTRRAEDVIFAGSARRHGTGMADVTLVIDNPDRLLPVDFGEVELGRRLYRSGENEYLLNRQRVRFRDLVELLDSANLADNAFLFIGQGMVDQALALRPEERRPLFEEAAGVRRHERRRRQAEAELGEAELNLGRVRDVLAELRPQVRRLAAQVEQQAARQHAGRDLATALVASARERWTAAESAARAAASSLAHARAESDRALATLREADDAAERLTVELGERAERERARRRDLDELRTRSLAAQLAETRRSAELAALERDRGRLAAERATLERRAEDARRALALPIPEDDGDLEAELAAVDRDLAAATADLGSARASEMAVSEAEAAARRREAARVHEGEEVRRRAAAAVRRAEEQRDRRTRAEEAARSAEQRRAAAADRLRAVTERETALEADVTRLREAVDAAEGEWRERARAVEDTVAALQAARARLETLDALEQQGSGSALARAAARRGGRRIVDGLEVEPSFRMAVDAALAGAAAGVVAPAEVLPSLAEQHGIVALPEGGVSPVTRDAQLASEVAARFGGGMLTVSLRQDPGGVVSRLVAAVVWVPDLASALEVRSALPFGWRVVTVAGELLSADGVVRLRPPDSALEQRAERERVTTVIAGLETRDAAAREALSDVIAQLEQRREEAERAGAALAETRSERRLAEEDDRATRRRADTASREASWEAAQDERMRADATRASAALAAWEDEALRGSPPGRRDGLPRRAAGATELQAKEARVAELVRRRDALAVTAGERATERRRLDDDRRRAEVTLGMDEARLASVDAEERRVVAAEAEALADAERLRAEARAAGADEVRLQAELEALFQRGSEDRALLQAVERKAVAAREALRTWESRSRDAEVSEMEARLQLESVREGLLVELAAIGPDGLAALGADADAVTEDDLAASLERSLAALTARWRTSEGNAEPGPAPGPGRLAALRRRYHELGAGNPFAAQEHAELAERVGSLEEQRADLERAITATRQLIGELTALITTQFRATFSALEEAFGRQFRQLFDGGDAQLLLTEPADLASTGVEIMARPPGKKRQPLAMLSGGERALTAVALLFAMLEVRPVPFCVLDEVDAALDEANIGRFATALRALSADIQFVVITHNRGTIEAADALYGVTLGDDAVSRVISLRLADASVASNGHVGAADGAPLASDSAPAGGLGTIDEEGARHARLRAGAVHE